jgi:hypothetical protein
MLNNMPILDAISDARTLIANALPRFGSALWEAQAEGSRAVVAAISGDAYAAQDCAIAAAHAAFEAVPGLRG